MSNKNHQNGTPVPPFALRPCRQEDYRYAEGLYVNTMRPLLSALDAWDPNDALPKFRSYFIPEEIEIITLDGQDIGLLQVVRTDESISLDQIHIEALHCGQGIGTTLIQELLSEARASGRPVLLSMVKHNIAQALYERLGFRVLNEDDTRVHMSSS